MCPILMNMYDLGSRRFVIGCAHTVRAVGRALVVAAAITAAVGSAKADEKVDKKETTKKTWSVDASHGTYSDSIPLEVPAFRSITPQLALSYDSSNGNGDLGVGWSLAGAGLIERASPGKGTPRYDASDVYVLEGEELVACTPGSASPSCTTGGTHSTKVESFRRIALSGVGMDSRWTVTAKNGTTEVYAPIRANGGDVFSWGLYEVVDTLGNVVTYGWTSDELGDHLMSIAYGGTVVDLYYEARPDQEFEAIGRGTIRTSGRRLTTVDVSVGGSRVRAYQLSYALSAATSRSLLTTVEQYGTDAKLDGSGRVSGGTSLPPITLEYQGDTPAFEVGNYDLALNNGSSTEYLSMDIDGDGKTDMLELDPVLFGMRQVTWLSDGTDFTPVSEAYGGSTSKQTQWIPMDIDGDGRSDLVEIYSLQGFLGRRIWMSTGSGLQEASNDVLWDTLFVSDAKFFPIDFDGDGLQDLLELSEPNGLQQRTVWISNGEGLSKGAEETFFGFGRRWRYFPMDINGDGLTDLLQLSSDFLSWNREVLLSDGVGFTLASSDEFQFDGGDDDDPDSGDKLIVLDINGDGRADLLQVHATFAATARKVWLSTGDGFGETSDEAGAWFDRDSWYLAMDVNGDGRSDLVEHNPDSFGFYHRQIWLSAGDSFVAGASDGDVGFNDGTKLMAVDVDGDGLSEMVELYPAGLVRGRRIWRMTTGEYPDLLASLTNEMGGTTAVSYTPSSAWDNTNNPPLLQTATAVTSDDGRGNVATTTYEYAGGLQDRSHRRFLGFRVQIETLPCTPDESACPYSETWFRQDYGAASKPERIDRRDGAGNLLQSDLYEYTTNGETIPWTSLRTGEWRYTYAGDGQACPGQDCKRTYSHRTYSEYGELAVDVDHGDYDVDGDERTTTTTFLPNTAAYIVSLPAEVKAFEGVGTSGELLAQTLSFYDGAGGWDQPPQSGIETTAAHWLSNPSSFVETHTEYDEWGNVVADIDPVGARTEYVYDDTYHLYRVSETNALAQSSHRTLDFVCGQPVETTDINGQVTTHSYDALCRLTQTVGPSGMFERHSWVDQGDPERQYTLLETPGASPEGEPRWTRTYTDGNGRTWRTVDRGPDAETGDIYVDTTYDARGQQASQTAAYYWAHDAERPETYATHTAYDAADRVTQVTYADGTFTTKAYALWSVIETDELGHRMVEHFDARRQRIAHDEFVDGEMYTTTYVYDARGNMSETIDPLGNVIHMETDSLGRKIRLDDPDLGTWTYGFDGADRITAQMDANKQRTEIVYDVLGRKTSQTTRAGTDEAVTVSWTYDEPREGYANVGKLTSIRDEAGGETYDHDVAGNVVRRVRAIDDAKYAFEHGFDAAGRKLWTTYPDGDTVGAPDEPLAYDGAGRLVSIPGYVDAVAYDAAGKVTRIENANGTVSVRERSPQRNWLAAISTASGDATIQDLAYTRDAKGQVTQVTSPFDDESWTYAYDSLSRLVAARNAASPEYDQELAYDAIGNVIFNSRIGEYAYESSRPHAVTLAGEHAYEYDAAGLMTSGAGRTLTWDGDNRLVSIEGAAAYADLHKEEAGDENTGCGVAGRPPFGGRGWWLLSPLVPLLWVRRRLEQTQGPATTRAGRVGLGLAAALALAVACSGGSSGSNDDRSADKDTTRSFVYDANGERVAQVEGDVTTHYLGGDDYQVEVGGVATKYIVLADSVVARKEGDTKTWVHTDNLGSIQAETDEDGEVVHRKTYRPYGEVLASEGERWSESRGFTGQRHDGSGLMYLHARYYDPTLGRFISPDSIISGGDNFGLNRYAYASNDPVNKTDIDGRSPDDPDAGDGKKPEAGRIGRAATAVGTSVRRGAAIGATMWALAGGGLVPPGADGVPDLRQMLTQQQQTTSHVGGAGGPSIGIREGPPEPANVPDYPGRRETPSTDPQPKPEYSVEPPDGPAGRATGRAAGRAAARFLGPVGVAASVGLAANDARLGYNEHRQRGGSIPGAVANAVKEAGVAPVRDVVDLFNVVRQAPQQSIQVTRGCAQYGQCG
jgi:RHS repeat-associated protein